MAALALAAGGQVVKGPKEPQKIANGLVSGLVRADDAVPTRGEWGEWHRYFRGDTHGTKDMVVLAVTLKPGQAPHPPHRHAEEEFMTRRGQRNLDARRQGTPPRKATCSTPPVDHAGLKNTGTGR